ncbi:hypothetical protein BKA65DRAFT_284663 [Rhexocercosporidium sp. MPI-PUGE-AT-0058]|nr:hypothetical protein BKA65DRAFT_284663 [Rhexocercosporidium sp. MPI-PUGE-AT-0058]
MNINTFIGPSAIWVLRFARVIRLLFGGGAWLEGAGVAGLSPTLWRTIDLKPPQAISLDASSTSPFPALAISLVLFLLFSPSCSSYAISFNFLGRLPLHTPAAVLSRPETRPQRTPTTTMPSTASSICANNGSVKSSTTQDNAESINDNLSTSPSASTSASATDKEVEDNSNLAVEQIAAFIYHPIDANPSYTDTSAEESIAEHTATMVSFFEDFETIMAENAAADEEGEGEEHDEN